MQVPEQYFPQQRHCRADPHRDHAGPQGALSGLLLHCRHLRRAGVCAHRRGPPSEPHQPLRREQAHRGEDAQVVRPGPRPQVLRPALLQRGRSLARRLHRRGSPAGEPPDPPHPPGGPGQAGAALPLRHRLPHQGRHLYPGLHPRGGISSTPTSWPWTTWKRTNTSAAFNLGSKGRASPTGRSSRPPAGSPATPSPSGRRAAAPATPPH